jgi:hypothetical protein
MSRHFSYYDKGWADEILECPICPWNGRFHQGATCLFPDFTDCQCPNCDIFTRPMLAIVMHPTYQEMLDYGSPEEKAIAERLIAKNKAFWAVALTKPEQLPDIPGDDDLFLTWDADYSEGRDQPRTVIRNGDQVLFSEPAAWEAIGFPGDGSSRYEGICKVLKQKYGDRVRELEPTNASRMWLYGDKMPGPTFRARIVDDVFGPQTKE